MNGEELKTKAKAGEVLYGSLLSMSRNPGWAPVIASCGLDFVIIDSEHTPRGRDDLADFVQAFRATGLVPIVRLQPPLNTTSPWPWTREPRALWPPTARPWSR